MRFKPAINLILSLCYLLSVTVLPARPVQANGFESGLSQGDYAPGRLIVGLADNFSVKSMALPRSASLSKTSGELEALNATVLEVPVGQEEAIRKQLLSSPEVLFVEPDYRVEVAAVIPDDPRWGEQYGPGRIQAPDAWEITTGSSSVILSIIDSGIEARHPEFAGRLVPGYDFVEGDQTPQDLCGHGTHVAGIAAATGNNALGVAGLDWNASIMPVRVLAADCAGYVSDVAEGIVWAVDHGADIINLSLGLGSPSRLLEYATYYAYDRGVAVFAASGNNETEPPAGLPIVYPAAFPWVMAVGATDAADNRAAFSRTGAQLDVMAPGVSILSTTPLSGRLYYSGLANEYGVLGGTSMAAGFATGAASLMSTLPQYDSPDALYEGLRNTARDLGAVGKDNLTGYGLIQLQDALLYTPTGTVPAPPEPLVEYDALSSRRCANINYQWLEVYAPGNFVPLFGNDQSTSVALPFDFEFGGRTYAAGVDNLTISTNGYISFDGFGESILSGYQRDNFIIPLPDDGPPYQRLNWFVAPFWDDLNPSAALNAGVYAGTIGSAPNRQMVIEWYQVPIQAASSSSAVTFEAVLFEGSNRILFQYKTLDGSGSDGSSATIGLEYNDGHTGVQYAYNQKGAVAEKQAILFVPRAVGDTNSVPGCLETTQAGPAGGFFSLEPFGLSIPAGLLETETTVRFTLFNSFPPAPSRYRVLRCAEITLDPTPPAPLSPMPLVTYEYSAKDVLNAGGNPRNMFLSVYDTETNQWEKLPTAVEAGQSRLSAPVSHFSVFCVFTLSEPESLPVTGAPLARNGLVVGILAALLAGCLGWWFWRRS